MKPRRVPVITVVALFAVACASYSPTSTRDAVIVPAATGEAPTGTCDPLALTVVVAGEGNEIPAAVERIAAAFRENGFDVKVESPENVIGNWIGTYLVPTQEGCARTACAASLNQILRNAGFHPGENSKNELQTSASCGFSVYVGFTPYAQGEFILY